MTAPTSSNPTTQSSNGTHLNGSNDITVENIDGKLDEYHKLYKQYHQSHVFTYLNELTFEEKSELLHDLQLIDIHSIGHEYQRALKEEKEFIEFTRENDITTIIKAFTEIIRVNEQSKDTLSQWYTTGLEMILKGEVGVILMSGGQGTRLKSKLPKGMYNIGLPSQKSLFQLQAERIQRLKQLAVQHYNSQQNSSKILKPTDISIPWYIMTSVATHHDCMEYFKANRYFHLPSNDVIFFKQGELPAFHETTPQMSSGQIIMSSRSRISLSPNGNGGIYSALQSNGILNDMKHRRLKYIHIYGVDNVLVKVADPTFFGFVASNEIDCANKVVIKNDPSERVGVMALRNGIPAVVEYSEIPESMSHARDTHTNQLLYGAANIVQHIFSVELLEKLANKPLPYHIARKAIQYVDASSSTTSGTIVTPTRPNGIKLEMFVFDVFQYAKKVMGYAVDRESEFTAVKNANALNAKDTPATAVRDLTAYHTHLIQQAGGKVVQSHSDDSHNDTSVDAVMKHAVEISPLVTYAGEALSEVVNGQTYTTPVHIH